jgi:peroxiredoxin
MSMITRLLLLLALATGLATTAAEPKPLKIGDKIPDVTLRSEEDREVKLREVVAARKTVLIFYRGGWCPFCTKHLQALAGIQDELRSAGSQIVAISMDQPSKLKGTPGRDKLTYTLLSDSDAKAAQAFGIAFKVEDQTVARYKSSYGLDLEEESGRTHHLLPHPAVYVVEPSGTLRFAHVNQDYKQRLEPAKILEAVRSVSQ